MLKEISKLDALDLFKKAETVYLVKAITKDTPVMELAFADGVFVYVSDQECESDETQAEEPAECNDDPEEEEAAEEVETVEAYESNDDLPPDVPDKYPAKKRGRKKIELDLGKIKSLYEGNWSIKKIADEMKVSTATVRKALEKIYE